MSQRIVGLVGACEIRDERPEDAAAVADIHTRAFGTPAEAGMVAAVREAGQATVSLLATLNGERLGHILFSPVTLDDSHEPLGVGLAPVGVMPGQQRRGIGSSLIEAGLHRCRLLGHSYVVVLGHPGYYPRFGFTPASTFGLRCEYPVPDEAFMALELRAGSLRGKAGTVRYHCAFGGGG